MAMDTAEQLTAIIIEDDDQVAYLLEILLSHEGFATSRFENGQTALEYVNNNQPPDLVLLDIMMPILDGYEVIKGIRLQEAWKETPVIMLTAKSQEKDIIRALDAGANDYVVKPFQPMELVARAKRLLQGLQ